MPISGSGELYGVRLASRVCIARTGSPLACDSYDRRYRYWQSLDSRIGSKSCYSSVDIYICIVLRAVGQGIWGVGTRHSYWLQSLTDIGNRGTEKMGI